MAISSSSDYKFPELPAINGDVILETFSHKSLSFTYNPEESIDNERLAMLGGTVLQLAVTNYLYRRKPVVRASDIPAQRDHVLSPEKFEKWVSHYNLRQRLRYNHSSAIDILASEETKALFQAYVGAVFTQCGPHIAINWISQLIDPGGTVVPVPAKGIFDDEQRASKRQRSDPLAPEAPPPPVLSSLPPASNPAPTPAHVIAPTSSLYSTVAVTTDGIHALPTTFPGSILNTSPKPSAFLPAFNQRCSQLHLQLEYNSENRGAAHKPLWVITCLVNGIQKGQGQGTSKQIAKEAAARQAYYSMGWAGYGQHAGTVSQSPQSQ